MPDCCREWDRKEWKHSKGQRETSQFLSLLIRCDMGEAEKKVRLDGINKKSRNVTTVTGWKCTTGGYIKDQLSSKCVTPGCLRFNRLTPITWGDFSFPHVSLQFTLHKPSWPHHMQSCETSSQQRAHSSPIDSDYRLCFILRLINSTLLRKMLDHDVFDRQGLMINLQWLSLAEYCRRW